MSTFNHGCYNGDEDVLKVPPVFWILTDFRSAPNLDKTVLLKESRQCLVCKSTWLRFVSILDLVLAVFRIVTQNAGRKNSTLRFF